MKALVLVSRLGCIINLLSRARKRQPDNREGGESCMAVLNNFYGDGIKWHDVSCHTRAMLVCEDSDQLLQRALRENPGASIREPVPKTQ